MARQDDLNDRVHRIRDFIRAVKLTAESMQEGNLLLVAIAFVFCLLWETLAKMGATAGMTKAELASTREKWTFKEGDTK